MPGLAGRWRRLFAGIIDAIIVGIITSPLSYRAVEYNTDGSLRTVHVQHIFLTALISFLYYFLLQAYWNGQTIGKKLFKMRVVLETGIKASVGTIAVRQLVMTLLEFVCCIGALIDLGLILIDRRKQAVHDKAAHTLVVDA
ncbi:RDD family protein [Streptosporangiaceae bacterium NEAU-GS5]|nr:RDD family protein [Streptosporangiaceae bacterium NEAU-GS5]